MKSIVIAVAATASFLAGGAAAAQTSGSIDGWVAQVNRQLDARMVLPRTGEHGRATVMFRRGVDGRAVDVAVESGRAVLKRAARATLARLRDLPPLPAAYEGRRIRLQLLVGDPSNHAGYIRDRNTMLTAATATNIRVAQRTENVQVAAAGGW